MEPALPKPIVCWVSIPAEFLRVAVLNCVEHRTVESDAGNGCCALDTKGLEGCKAYCAPNATFTAQAEPLAGIKTLAEYADWMKGLMTNLPDGTYEVKSERNNVAAYASTHIGPGGPCEPTGT